MNKNTKQRKKFLKNIKAEAKKKIEIK